MASLLGDSNSDSSSDESSLDVSLISSSRTSFRSTAANSPTSLKKKMSRWLNKVNVPGGKGNLESTTLDLNNLTFSSSNSDTDSSNSDYDESKPYKKKRNRKNKP